jgi:hypothetical protein
MIFPFVGLAQTILKDTYQEIWHTKPLFGSGVGLLHVSLENACETCHDGSSKYPATNGEEHA